MFSMMSFAMVSAQDPQSNISVVAGETGIADFTATTSQADATVGGLVSQIVETTHRTVKLAGVTVLDRTNITQIKNFSFYLFNTGAQINHNNLVNGDVYQSSQNIEVRNVTGSWTTLKVNSTTIVPSGDKAAALNENFTSINGTIVKALSVDMGGAHTITFSNGTISVTQFDAATLCGGLTTGQAKTLSGSTSPKDTYCGQLGNVKVIGVDGTSGAIPTRFIYDLDSDGDFNDMVDHTTVVNGYKTSSINGQALALIPAGSYDLFAII